MANGKAKLKRSKDKLDVARGRHAGVANKYKVILKALQLKTIPMSLGYV